MDTIVPVTVPKVAKLTEALAARGIHDREFRATLDDVVKLNKIAAIMALPTDIDLDLSGEFDQEAMVGLVRYLFKDYTKHQAIMERHQAAHPGKYVWLAGSKPDDLVSTNIIKQLLDGLGERHIAVAVLRSGLLDGRELSVGEVAQRVDVNADQVRHLRKQANTHMKAQARALYPFGRWITKPEVRPQPTGLPITTSSPIEELGLSTRTYNALVRANLLTVGDVLGKSREELGEVRNLITRSIDEIEYLLSESGLRLRQG